MVGTLTKKHPKNAGFTIVELIVIIAVIGILAAITIVSYNAVQENSADATVRTDLNDFASKANRYKSENGGNGRTSDTTQTYLESLNWKATKRSYDTSVRQNLAYCHNRIYYASTNPADVAWSTNANGRTNWILIALSKSGKVFYVTDTRSVAAEYKGGAIDFDAQSMCGQVISALGTAGYSGVYHGHVPADTTTGPWRAWVGGN